MVYVLLWQLFKDDLTKVIEFQLKNIHWCLLIEKGICLTWNVCIWSKLVILLNPKKAYTFFQQWAGKVINCISSNNYISLVCTKINIFYFILGCKLLLIGILSFLDSSSWPWSVVTNVVKWTWSKYLHLHRSKTMILFTLFFVYLSYVSSNNMRSLLIILV